METSLTILSTVLLAPHTTLGVGGRAKLYVEVQSREELVEAIRYAKTNHEPWMVIGGGSNIFVLDTGYDGLVIKMLIKGIEEVSRNEETVIVKVGAGVILDTFVEYTVEKGWWGLENLSSIPGTVGATPVQNVGAYGVEISNTLVSVEVYDTTNDTFIALSNDKCSFGYRTSVFKVAPQRYVIVSVTFSLSQIRRPHCTYADLANFFTNNASPTLQDIRHAIQVIRAQKFPDWSVVGTAGSFFKNPIISKQKARALLKKFPDLPHYQEGEEMVKFPLGYILDKICNLKGYKKGRVGLYKNQALVLVVEKGTSTKEVVEFVEEIKQKVFNSTGITIEREVTLLETKNKKFRKKNQRNSEKRN